MSDYTDTRAEPETPFSQCSSRFMTVEGMDPDAMGQRLRCARTPNHGTQHRNASGDLSWDHGAEIVVIQGTMTSPIRVVSQDEIRHQRATRAVWDAWQADGIVEHHTVPNAVLEPLAEIAATAMLGWVQTPEGRMP